ncbi:MAG: hypothetical protein QM804_12245 [Propionicimonas sp.]
MAADLDEGLLDDLVGSSLLTPILYLIAMGIGLGTLVDAGSGGVAGVPYLTFVAPGLLVSTVVMSAGSEATFPVMDGFKWSKLYFARAATAASPLQVAVGEVVAIGIRFLVEAADLLAHPAGRRRGRASAPGR